VASINNSISQLEQKKLELIMEANQKSKQQSMTEAVLSSGHHGPHHHDCGCAPPRTVVIKPELPTETVASILTPISQYVIDPNRLAGNLLKFKCLTSLEISTYTPAYLAATDLYKRHVKLIRDFVDTNRVMQQASIQAMQASLSRSSSSSYTTLEETKAFIAKNRPKPLSMKEAMRLVKEEEKYR
jgi:hypothetical protein